MAKVPYHTALSNGEYAPGKPTDVWTDERGNVAAAWSIMSGVYPGARDFDVVYGELPWKAGFDRFNERAGAGGYTFDDLMRSAEGVTEECVRRGVTVYWPIGAAVAKDYLTGGTRLPITLNGHKCLLSVHGAPTLELREGETTTSLMARLAQVHRRVYDPACGFGTTGRVFAEAGKNFSITDYNAGCVGKIAELAPTWLPLTKVHE